MLERLATVLGRERIIAREKFLNAAVLVAFYSEGGEPYLLFEKRATSRPGK